MDFSQFDLTDPFVRRALAETLAEDNGLDYQDEYIRKALNDEIAAAAAPKPIDGERNFLGDTVSRLARGGVQLADTAIHAVDTAVGGSETLQGWSDSLDKAKQNVGLFRPDKSEHEEGWLKRSYGQALESAPMSTVPWAGAMAGAKAGAALGTMALPGAGTAAGMVAGGLIGGTLAMGGLFGLGTYGQRKEEIERELTATRPDLTPDEISKMAHDNAKNHAFAETGGESAGDLASWAILSKVPGGQAIFKGGKAILAELVKPNAFKAIALGIGKSMPFEVGSEVGTAIWQNEADKAIGVEQGTSTDAALAAIGPALFLSAGMGVAVGGYSANQRRVQYNALNSEDQQTRAQAVDQVAGTLTEATDQQTAKKWRDMALGFVQNGQPIPLDMNLAELSANEPEVAAPEAQDQPAETILKAESVDEAIQEAEAEIAKPGWLAPTVPDSEESAWLQQGVAAKAYNQGRNELGATPVSRAGLLGQAMEPMQVAPPILTENQEVEESNVGRGTVSGDSGGVAGQPEQPAGVRDTEPVSADSGQLGDGEGGAGVEQASPLQPEQPAGVTAISTDPIFQAPGIEAEVGIQIASPLLTAARQHVAETGDMTMGGLAMALDVDIDTAEKLLEQVKATTPLPRNIGGTQVATVGADTGGFLNDQAIRKTGATSPAATAGDAQGFIADQGIRKAAGAVTAAPGADTEGFVRDQQIRRDAMGRGPKPTRAADEPARAFLARKREWEKGVSQTGGNETQAGLPRTDETQAGAGGAGEMKKLVASIKKSDAKLEKLHEGQLNRMKNGGQSRATSTTYAARSGQEAKHRDGEARVLANIARAELRAGRAVPQDVIDILGSKIEYNRSGDYEPIEGVTAPSPGEASTPPAAQPSASKATPEKPETEQLVRWQNAVNAYVNGEDAANARTDTIDRALQNGLVKPGEAVSFAEWLIGQGGRPGLVDHARKVQGGTESTEDSHSDEVKDIENVVAQKRARVERTLAAMKKGTKAQKEAAGREHLFAKKELQGWEQVLEDVRAEQQPPTTPAQDRTPEKPAGVATSGQRQEQTELADAKPRKDEGMADIDEPTQGTPKWAEEHATSVGGSVVYHDKETALVEGYSLLTGEPIHAGVLKSSGSRTRVNIAKYTGKMFTDEQKQNLIKQSERVRAEEQRLHEENPDGPFVGGQRVAASEHIPEWVAETVREWTALLGIKRRVYITTIEDAKRDADKFHGPFGAIRSASLTSENQRGTHRQLSNGDSYLVLRPSGQKALLLEVMGHEIGHILEKEAWVDAPQELKAAVERDFNAWRDRRGVPGKEWVDSMRAMRTARKTDVAAGVTSDTMQPYWKSFSEYFADQTARWAMTSEKPRSVVERFFKRIADKLKQLYAAVAGQKFLPSESMRAYLDSRAEAAIAVRQVSVEVAAQPAQAEAASGERGEEDGIVEHTTRRGKVLRGRIVTGISYRQAKEADPYTFKKDGGFFIREGAGEVKKDDAPAEVKETAPEKAEAQPKENLAIKRLRMSAERLKAAGEAKLNQDRNANTARRARMANNAEADARADIRTAETLLNIVNAQEDGTAGALAGLTSKAQLETLQGILTQAKYAEERKKENGKQDHARPANKDDIKSAVYLYPHFYDYKDLDALIDLLGNKKGWRTKRNDLRRGGLVVNGEERIEMLREALKLAGDDYRFRTVGEHLKGYDRLQKAGITDDLALREALERLVELSGKAPEKNRAQELERALVGQNTGIDFFPTPKAQAKFIVDRAGIEPGMRVLEPSAGTGNLAEEMRAQGGEVEVAEISPAHREVLEAKGFKIVEHDFMDMEEGGYDVIVMNPPFSNNMDIDHVRKAYELLKPGGRVVAIMGEGAFFLTGKKEAEFREWLDEVGINEKLPEGFFTDKKELRTTGVNARVVEIDKPIGAETPVFDEKQEAVEAEQADPTEAPIVEPEAIPEQRLLDTGFLREFRDRWQYKLAGNNGWFTADRKEDAVERARKAYEKTPEPERLTAQERFDKSTAEQNADIARLYGDNSLPELRKEYARMEREIASLQKAGRREFDGNGGRRTGAAVSNEGARNIGEQKLKLGRYIEDREKAEKESTPTRLHTVSGYPNDNATKKHMLEAIAEARKELPEPSPKDGFSNAERIDWPKPTTEKSHKIYRLAGNFKLVVDPTGYARLSEDMGSSGKDGSKIPDKVHGKPIGNLAEAKLWAEYYLLGKAEPSGPPHVFRGKNKEYEYTIPNSAYALDNFEKKVKGSSGVKFSERTGPTLESIKAKYAGRIDTIFVHERNDGDIHLASVIVGKGNRQQGIGSEFMADLVAYADANGKRIVLSPGQPDDRHGTTSRARLVRFYKRFGFIENKGRNKDYQISEGMYRVPAPKYSTALPPSARADIPGELTQAFGKLRARVLMRKITVLESQEEAKALVVALSDFPHLYSFPKQEVAKIALRGSNLLGGYLNRIPGQDQFERIAKDSRNLSRITTWLDSVEKFAGNASSPKRSGDGRPSDVKQLANLLKTTTFFSEGYGSLDAPTKAKMLLGVRGLIQNDKIFNSVVGLDAIDVVNMLGGEERSSEFLLNNPSMLSDLLAAYSNHPVPILVDSPGVSAGSRTKKPLVLVDTIGVDRNNLSASKTRNEWHGVSVDKKGSKGLDQLKLILPQNTEYSNQRIQGFAVDGKVYLVRDGIEKGHTIPVLKHEFAHIARLGLRGTKPWQALLRSVDERMNEDSATGKALREARKKVPADTDAGLIAEETLAYAVEDSPEVGIVRRAIAMIKRFLVNMGVSPNIFTVEDWSALAAATLRGQARVAMGEQIAYSVRESIQQAKAFFSKLQQVSDDKFGGMKAQSVEPFLLKQGVKKTEIEATGLREWLAAMKPTDKVTKEQLRDFVRANTVEFEDVVLGGEEASFTPEELAQYEHLEELEAEGRLTPEEREMLGNMRWMEPVPQFPEYTEPGAVPGSYREMFVTVPKQRVQKDKARGMYAVIGADGEEIVRWAGKNKEEIEAEVESRRAGFPVYRGATVIEVESPSTHLSDWQDGHSQYSEIKNPIVRIRFNETTGPNGERVLRVEEMQGPSAENQKQMPQYLRDNIYQTGVKRILAYAKENGFDGVALATKPGRTAGETQADRYSLEKQIKSLAYYKNDDGTYGILTDAGVDRINGRPISSVDESELPSVVGKEVAEKIASGAGEEGVVMGNDGYVRAKTLSGVALRSGGEGLRQLYDTDLPNIFKAWGGAKMGDVGGMPYIPVDKAASSYPMFSVRFEADEAEIVERVTNKYDIFPGARAFLTPEYTLVRDPAGKRAFDAARKRATNKHEFGNWILDGTTPRDAWDDESQGDYADHYTGTNQTFLNAMNALDEAEYTQTNDYLTDADKPGAKPFRVRHIKGFEVRTPDGTFVGFAKDKPATYDLKSRHHRMNYGEKSDVLMVDYKTDPIDKWIVFDGRAPVGRFDEEAKAIQTMMDKEGEKLTGKGFSEKSVGAVRVWREMTNRAFDLEVSELRKIEAQRESMGLPPLEFDMVDETKRWAIKDKQGNPVATYEFKEDAELHLRELAKYKAGFAHVKITRQSDSEIMGTGSIHDYISMLGDLRGSYFPRQRPSGGIVLTATNADGRKVREHFDLWISKGRKYDGTNADENALLKFARGNFNALTPLGRRIRALEKEGFKREDIVVEKAQPMPEEVYDVTGLASAINALMDESLQNVKDKSKASPKLESAFAELHKAMAANLANIFKERGGLSSRIRRNPTDYWEGFETDMKKAGVQYARRMAATIAKRQAAQEITLALTGRDISFDEFKAKKLGTTWEEYADFVNKRKLDPKTQPNLYGEAMSWTKEVLRNDEQVDRIIGTLRGLATLKLLGLRVSSAAVNLTNLLTGVPATISHYSGGSATSAVRQVTRSLKALADYKRGKSSGLDKQVITEIKERGLDSALFNHEAMGVLRSKVGNAGTWVSDKMMGMFGFTERINRAATIHAAYMELHRSNPDMTHAQLMEKAEIVSNRAHGLYGDLTAPMWTRGSGNPLRMTFTFMKFSQNYMMNMGDMVRKKDYKNAAYLLLSPAILGGLGASAATPVIMGLARAFGMGDDPEEELYTWAAEVFGSDTVMRHGLPGLVGLNFKGSLAVNNPVPTTIEELFGAPGSLFFDIRDAVRETRRGAYGKAAEKFFPTGVVAPFKAIREYDEGVTTGSYSRVHYGNEPLKATGYDAVLRAFSFNPSRISGIREKQWSEDKIARRYRQERTDINTKVKKAWLKGNGKISHADWLELMAEVESYNERVKGLNLPDITPITKKALRLLLRRQGKPNKRERLRTNPNI